MGLTCSLASPMHADQRGAFPQHPTREAHSIHDFAPLEQPGLQPIKPVGRCFSPINMCGTNENTMAFDSSVLGVSPDNQLFEHQVPASVVQNCNLKIEHQVSPKFAARDCLLFPEASIRAEESGPRLQVGLRMQGNLHNSD